MTLLLFLFLAAGLKFDVSSATDSREADALGYKNDYIMIYSNSWGPYELGFIVDGPKSYVKTTFSNAVTSVSCTIIIGNMINNSICIYYTSLT